DGPIRYGMTYMVRPRMAPCRMAPAAALASAGAIQLLGGPASSRSGVQMKGSCSVRATSIGGLRWREELGYRREFSGNSDPSRSIPSMSPLYSSFEPSHHTTREGRVTSAACSTHFSALLVTAISVSSRCRAVLQFEGFEELMSRYLNPNHFAVGRQ